jgi:NAD(P)-dependent dehydrogenase (short-subunit alcohol dehydrogenase family)
MLESSLKEKTVVIAGAAGGLGSVASSVFGAAGANLALLGRDPTKLKELVGKLDLPSNRTLTLASDVASPQEMKAAADAILQKFKGIHVLVNLVGGWIGGKPVFETKPEELSSMLDQHLFAGYTFIRALVPPMLKNKWGRVLAVSSPNASQPPGNNSPYAVGKAAMEILMLSLAAELKGSGVTANVLLVRTIDVAHEREKAPNKENQGWTSPEEISATLLHLCSDQAGIINGARIPLYGETY